MSDDQAKLTPVLNQYKSVKKQYPDALLFFRMGDFYELFFDDARVASAELQLALTSRNKNDPNFVPMCGFPWHAAQPYLTQLLEKGYNVAICEQIGDPKTTKGIVERAVTRVVTPATALDDAALGAKTHNYLGAVCMGLHSCGFVWADISTGQWSGLEFKRQSDMWTWVGKLAPRELLIPDGQQAPATLVQAGIRVVHQPAVNFELKRGLERVLEVQEVREAGALGLDDKPSLTRACGALIAYIQQTQVTQPVRLLPFKPMDLGKRLIIDDLTEKNLEIFVRLNGQKGKGTLREVIDETLTPMGGRLMEDMLRHPWRDIKRISQIQESAAWLMANDDIRESLRTILADLRDLERIITRIILNRGSFRDLLALRQSAEQLPRLKDLLTADDAMASGLRRAGSLMDDLSDCAELLRSALADSEAEGAGGMFRSGYCASLDEQIELAEHGENKLRELLETERQKTGITRLKLGYNRVFGYFFEAPRSGLSKELPERFVRRQTLANGERFATEELKQLEDDILQAGERRKELENELFLNLLEHVGAQKERVLQTADLVAQIDYWQSLAHVARRDGWVMPELTEENEIHIREGRHPVIENIIGQANFVANDFHMDKNRGTCLITGPNMAGKSTILRQVAIIVLLAQMGSAVPASAAVIGVVDRLFSRVGASDNIAQGQSTFMVEMMETARILRQAGKRSLIILDEIGRGTSTYDGMALAWAILENLAERPFLRAIFATHYHELTSLENRIPGLFNMNVAVGDYDSKEIIFLHRLMPGPADRSYGVEVARLAGVPPRVVQRAREILKSLERTRARQAISNLILPGCETTAESAKNKVLDELGALDPAALDGEKALTLINGWRDSLRKARE